MKIYLSDILFYEIIIKNRFINFRFRMKFLLLYKICELITLNPD